MVYVSIPEEMGIEKGVIIGKEENKRETALRMLEWGDSDEKIVAYARITPEELAELKEKVFQGVH